MESLASAILIQMVRDSKKSEFEQELQEFVNSEWFETLSEVVDIDPKAVREKFTKGNYIKSFRAAYH